MAFVDLTRGNRHIESGDQIGPEFLHDWKSHGGEDAPQCAMTGCAPATEGAYVVKTDAADKRDKVFIVPICHECNQLKEGCELQFKSGARGIEVHHH